MIICWVFLFLAGFQAARKLQTSPFITPHSPCKTLRQAFVVMFAIYSFFLIDIE